MDEPNTPAPRRGTESDADLSGLFRDARPRRLLTDDDPTEVRPRTRETLWRADDAPHATQSAASQRTSLDDFLREDDNPAPEHADVEKTTASSSQPGFRRTVLFTILSTLIPGLGLVGSRQKANRWLGGLVALGFVGATIAGVVFFTSRVKPDPDESFISAAASAAVGLASGRGVLHIATALLIGMGLLWVALIVMTHVATRSNAVSQGKRLAGAILVGVLSLAVAAPVAVGAAYSQVLASTLSKTFGSDNEVVSGSKPTLDGSGENPFGDLKRLNIMLIGSDLDEGRIASGVKESSGFRTDTVMLASVDTTTGATTLIQIPRNLQYTPFPEGSEMAKEFPDGFRGEGDPAEWHFNAIWERIDRDYPHLFAGQTYRGAEALKQGVEGITGLPVHYFLLLNIDGLRNLIDAMGGVTVNINERLPMGGNSENRRAKDWLEVGANQHLNGDQGLWYARSRWSTSDYSRMERQSCLIKAITDQANPTTLLTRFEAIAGASSDMVLTDIPQHMLEALTDLALKTQKQKMLRLAFTMGKNGYSYQNPDFDAMRAYVEETIDQSTTEPTAAPTPAPTSDGTSSDTPDDTGNEDDADNPDDNTEDDSTDDASTEPENADDGNGAEDIADACAFNPKEE